MKGFPKLDERSRQSTLEFHKAVEQFINQHGYPDRESPDAIGKQLEGYFKLCLERGERPRVWGMAAVLRLNRRELYHVIVGNFRSRFSDESIEVIRFYYQLAEMLIEKAIIEGRADGYDFFLMTKSYGYTSRLGGS